MCCLLTTSTDSHKDIKKRKKYETEKERERDDEGSLVC